MEFLTTEAPNTREGFWGVGSSSYSAPTSSDTGTRPGPPTRCFLSSQVQLFHVDSNSNAHGVTLRNKGESLNLQLALAERIVRRKGKSLQGELITCDALNYRIGSARNHGNSPTTSRRLADRKVEKFEKNITKRGAVPETTAKKGKDYPVGPILLGFFVFVVIGSSLFQIIRTATSGGMA
ncbi:hypothetical protein GBA52_003418 [Prunus armeniaca]|nr:hypothetical protein GBA52_003418 [Prunus armeniaca]